MSFHSLIADKIWANAEQDVLEASQSNYAAFFGLAVRLHMLQQTCPVQL